MHDGHPTRARFLERLLEPVFHVRRYDVLELDLGWVREAAAPEGVEIRAFGEADWAALDAACGRRTRTWLRRWVPRGLRGFVAMRAGRLVGHGWYGRGAVPQPHLYPGPLPADAIVLPWVWVAPAERGRGVASALLAARVAEARAAGCRRAWIAIRRGNEGPLRELARACGGLTPRRLGALTLLRVLGVRRRGWRPAGTSS